MSSKHLQPLLVALTGLAAAAALGVLSPVPAALALAVMLVLAALAALSPVGLLAAVVVTLPYFYRPIGIGALEFAASELLLTAAVAGTAARMATDAARADGHFHRLHAVVKLLLQSKLVLFLALLAVTGVLALFVLHDPSARDASLREWRWSFLEPLLFVGLLTLAARSRTDRAIMAGSLIAAGVLAAIHGIVDVAGGGGVAADNIRRLSGPLPHPNALALFMLRPFVLAAALFSLLPEMRRLLLIPALLTGLVLLGTFSRGAMIAVGFAALILALDAPRRVQRGIASASIAAAAAVTVLARDRMANLLEGGSVSLRLDIWRSAVEMLRDRPVWGFGPDQFFYAYAPRYIQPTAWDERFTSHAHNLLADSWIRLGVLGVIAALVALVVVGRRIVKDRQLRLDRPSLSRAAALALGATLVHGLIDNAYFGHDLAMSAWLLAWLAFEPARQGSGDRCAMSKLFDLSLTPASSSPRRWLAWLAVLLVAFTLALSIFLLGPFSLVAAVSGVVLLLALLRAPWLGVLMLVASVPAQALGALQAGGQTLTLTRAVFPLAVAGYVIGVVMKRERLKGTWLLAPYVGFALVMLTSLGWAGSMTAAGAELGRWGTALVSFVILLHFLLDASQRRLILFVGIMALGGVFEATFGATQSVLAIGPASFRVGDAGSRAFGTFGQPNSYAGYLEMVLFPVAWMGVFLIGRLVVSFRGYRDSREQGMNRSHAERVTLAADTLVATLFCLSTLVILGGILASYSRGAWLGVAAGGLATILLYHRRARIAVFLLAPAAALVLLGGITSVVPQSVSERITTGFDDVRPFDASRVAITDDNFAAAERMAHWQAGWRMFTDQPLTGVGAGNFNEEYPDYYVREQFSNSRGHAHNYYIHVLAETGLAGLASYLVLVGSLAALGLIVLLNAPQGFNRMLTLGGFGTIVATGVHNVFENLQVLNLSIQLGLIWILVIVGHRRWRANQPGHAREPAMEIHS